MPTNKLDVYNFERRKQAPIELEDVDESWALRLLNECEQDTASTTTPTPSPLTEQRNSEPHKEEASHHSLDEIIYVNDIANPTHEALFQPSAIERQIQQHSSAPDLSRVQPPMNTKNSWFTRLKHLFSR